MTTARSAHGPALILQYPMSLAVYDTYPLAQHVVAYLAGHGFPVQNIAIVGTGLTSVERVTHRLRRNNIAVARAITGFSLGVFLSIAVMLFSKQSELGLVLAAPVLGALGGLAWSQIGFAAGARHGGRGFASVSQIAATRYEVFVEHHFAEQARALLAGTSFR